MPSGGEFHLVLKNVTENIIIVQNIIVANSFFKRLRGLMFTDKLSPSSGLLIFPCSGIHTFNMNYTIDVLYLDINNKILAIDESMAPGKIGEVRKGVVSVVELNGGKAKETLTKVGQTVEFI